MCIRDRYGVVAGEQQGTGAEFSIVEEEGLSPDQAKLLEENKEYLLQNEEDLNEAAEYLAEDEEISLEEARQQILDDFGKGQLENAQDYVDVLDEYSEEEHGVPAHELDEEQLDELREDRSFLDEMGSQPTQSDVNLALDFVDDILAKRREGVELSVEEGAQDQSSEVDRVKSLDIDAEDGATFNQDGTVYNDGGLVVPIASTNVPLNLLTDEKIENFKKKYADYMGPASKIGIYKFPGQNMASIDLNVIAPNEKKQDALIIAKRLGQESLFDLDTFENIKTGESGQLSLIHI